MYKLLLYGIASAVLALVVIFITIFFIDINQVKLETSPLQMQKQPKDFNHTSLKGAWLSKTDQDRDDAFYYPVTEIRIDLNLLNSVDEKYKQRIRNFRLQTQKLSDYHYFCLKQVLDQSQVHHKIERYENEIGVILYSNSQKTLRFIVDELRKYGITSQVREINKR